MSIFGSSKTDTAARAEKMQKDRDAFVARLHRGELTWFERLGDAIALENVKVSYEERGIFP